MFSPTPKLLVVWLALGWNLLLPGENIANGVSLTGGTEKRKRLYRQTVLASYGNTTTVAPCPCDPNGAVANPQVQGRDPSLPLWPAENLDLPPGSLDRVFCRITCVELSTGDFDLAQLVRILYITKDTVLQNDIVSRLETIQQQNQLDFWLRDGENHNVYWTENHMILWMSSHYLIQQFLGVADIDSLLLKRLHHYLQLKQDYGFYEFFSTNYNPVTVAGLLNLVDFCQDEDISAQALALVTRLLKEWLMTTSTEGFLYPAAGRNILRLYRDRPFLSMVWMMTGAGRALVANAWSSDFVGAFLATSSIDLEPIVVNWTRPVDTMLTIGHSINDHLKIHASLDLVNRTMFQWSAGDFFQPRVIADTLSVVDKYQLEDHMDWNDLRFLFQIPRLLVSAFLKTLPGLTKGSDISGAKVKIYKNKGVVLTSVEDFNVGFRSAEQWVWAATVGDIAVWTQSGVTGPQFLADTKDLGNTHMPQIQQDSNVALISYRT
jgi:hypothetical protein